MAASIICVGNATLDRIWTVESLPRPGQKIRSHAYLEVGGGQAANAAVAAARLGGRVNLVSAVGVDAAGEKILEQLRAEQIDVDAVQVVAGARSISSVILVERGGERVVVGDVDPALYAVPPRYNLVAVERAQAVLADVKWPAQAEVVLRQARCAGISIVLDVEPAMAGNHDLLCPLADHAIFGQAGLAAYTCSDDASTGLQIAKQRLGCIVGVTLGARGVLMSTPDGQALIDAPRVAVADTTGAGDTFHGAYTLAIAEGRDALAAARFACAAAALKCTMPGRAGMPTRGELDLFMAGT